MTQNITYNILVFEIKMTTKIYFICRFIKNALTMKTSLTMEGELATRRHIIVVLYGHTFGETC